MRWMDSDGWHEENKRKYEKRTMAKHHRTKNELYQGRRQEIKERARLEEEQLAKPAVDQFILKWHGKFRESKVQESDLWPLAGDITDMPDFAWWNSRVHNLANLLLRLRGRVYHGLRLCVGRDGYRRVFWLERQT